MTAFVQNLGWHTGSRHVTRQIASDNRTGANAGFAMHGNVVHDVTARTDVDFVSYMCRARQIGTNRGELSDVYIVSNDSMAVNDNAKTMLNVKTYPIFTFAGMKMPYFRLYRCNISFVKGYNRPLCCDKRNQMEKSTLIREKLSKKMVTNDFFLPLCLKASDFISCMQSE